MIDGAAIEQIVAQYEKHGWRLRRVLISGGNSEAGERFEGLLQDVDPQPADLDGLWFSRSSRPGLTAWELRHLSTTPYALVENISDEASDEEREEALKRTEIRMMQALTSTHRDH